MPGTLWSSSFRCDWDDRAPKPPPDEVLAIDAKPPPVPPTLPKPPDDDPPNEGAPKADWPNPEEVVDVGATLLEPAWSLVSEPKKVKRFEG